MSAALTATAHNRRIVPFLPFLRSARLSVHLDALARCNASYGAFCKRMFYLSLLAHSFAGHRGEVNSLYVLSDRAGRKAHAKMREIKRFFKNQPKSKIQMSGFVRFFARMRALFKGAESADFCGGQHARVRTPQKLHPQIRFFKVSAMSEWA